MQNNKAYNILTNKIFGSETERKIAYDKALKALDYCSKNNIILIPSKEEIEYDNLDKVEDKRQQISIFDEV